MKSELTPICEEDLVSFCNGKKFRWLTACSARNTMKTGLESGFSVVRNIQNNLYYSGCLIGKTDSIGEEFVEAENIFEEKIKIFYHFFDLHFHPTIRSYVFFSGPQRIDEPYGDLSDLTSFRHHSTINCKPIYAVCHIDTNNKGEILIIQETNKKPLTHRVLVDVYGELSDFVEKRYPSTFEIAEKFNETGLYKSTSLEFKLTQSGILISDDEIEKVKIFAYTPAFKK